MSRLIRRAARLSTRAASPLQQYPANPRSQHCGAGSTAARAAGRERAEREAPRSRARPPAPWDRYGHGAQLGSIRRAEVIAPRRPGSAGLSEASLLPASGTRQQLFVRAADGSAERSRLFPVVGELTSSCSLSLWSIIVSSVTTIALWCCIVLLPFGFRRNAAARLHSIYSHSSMQDLIRCG